VIVLDRSADGKTFLVQTVDPKAKKAVLGLAKLGDKEVTPLIELRDRGFRITNARFSPDGKTVLYIDADPDRKDAHKWGHSQTVYTLSLADKKRERFPDFPENARGTGIAWSPDGKKVAYTWQPLDDEILKKDTITPDDIQKETEGFLIVCDADGRNAKTVATDKGTIALNWVFGAIDWR
jgi:dipeptidyl aminopeptidase/acylaminoacyl peptidase